MSPLPRRMIEDMQIRNLTPHAQRAYVEHIARFARHFSQSENSIAGPADATLMRARPSIESSLRIGSRSRIKVCAEPLRRRVFTQSA